MRIAAGRDRTRRSNTSDPRLSHSSLGLMPPMTDPPRTLLPRDGVRLLFSADAAVDEFLLLEVTDELLAAASRRQPRSAQRSVTTAELWQCQTEAMRGILSCPPH